MAVFVITAGHSDSDPGAISPTGVTEESIAEEARDMLASALLARGHAVLMDGNPGQNLPLSAAMALIGRGAIAVELHTNSASSTATGVETISLPKHKALSQALSKALSDALGLRLRGDKGWIDQSQSARGRLGYVSAGGIIVELFFLSNPNDYAAWQAKKTRAIEALADVLVDHYG